MNKITNILLRHNFIHVPVGSGNSSTENIATVMMNLSYYGYSLDVAAYKALATLSDDEFAFWWAGVEAELKSITGDDRKISDFVVYKNFPAEVLSKSEAEYWLPQFFMYWGFPKEMFTQPEVKREEMTETRKFIVLKRANKESLSFILNQHLASPARWKEQEFNEVTTLAEQMTLDISKLAFKENLVRLVTFFMEGGHKVTLSTATDVLRLAAGLSDGDVSLREKVKFKSFKKPMRRYLLSMLEDCKNISEDVARRREVWKRMFHNLHAGDYRKSFPKVIKVVDDLYNDRLTTFNAGVELAFKEKNVASAMQLLSQRPGDFRRRLVQSVNSFGDDAVSAFSNQDVLNKLSVHQILSLKTHLESINNRTNRVFPPKGNWSKMKVAEAKKIDPNNLDHILTSLRSELSKRVPSVSDLDLDTSKIKLPSNGDIGPFTRGTRFPIPENVKFIRSASYWKQAGRGTIWFDNGWNFFSNDWKSLGSCSWMETRFPSYNKDASAVFSGDPVNSKEMLGRGAQLIDLYPEKLKAAGVRYALWNILCYSNIPFSDAEDVFAALQWGEHPQKGNLFEPSRCQLAFPLTGKQKTKYISLIDLDSNEMVYLDVSLTGKVNHAGLNNQKLSAMMPPFMEYINALPSVFDLFSESLNPDKDGIKVLYSDKDIEVNGGPAYVFRPENERNKYDLVDLNQLLKR